MRTLTSLILLPLVVLAPLLMIPTAYAIESEPQPTVFVTVQSSELVEVNNEIQASLAGFAIGTKDRLSGGLQGFTDITGMGSSNGYTHDGGELLSGNIAFLTGMVTRSTDLDLLRTPVAITANATDGVIVFVFGPIPSGRLAGQIFIFRGTGTVVIVCLDCRSD